MPDESKKSIEELLQASAKARRAEFGSDPEMPNPMRARLHDEIARVARENEPKAPRSWNWFAISWPIGTVAAAVLVVAFVMSRSHEFQRPSESRQIATNREEGAKGTLQPVPPQVAAKANTESATKPADVLKPENEQQSSDSRRFADVAAEPKDEAPAVAAAPQPGSAASSSQFFAQSRQTLGNINQRFSQGLRGDAARRSKRSQSVNVLSAFQIQQNGDQIRVVDADGSTYAGKIESTQATTSKTLEDGKQALAKRSERDLSQQNANQFYFRASGYSNSLQKSIVFEGNYIATPAQAQKPNEFTSMNEQQSPARIVGTAKITGESPIEVDATSLPQ